MLLRCVIRFKDVSDLGGNSENLCPKLVDQRRGIDVRHFEFEVVERHVEGFAFAVGDGEEIVRAHV